MNIENILDQSFEFLIIRFYLCLRFFQMGNLVGRCRWQDLSVLNSDYKLRFQVCGLCVIKMYLWYVDNVILIDF